MLLSGWGSVRTQALQIWGSGSPSPSWPPHSPFSVNCVCGIWLTACLSVPHSGPLFSSNLPSPAMVSGLLQKPVPLLLVILHLVPVSWYLLQKGRPSLAWPAESHHILSPSSCAQDTPTAHCLPGLLLIGRAGLRRVWNGDWKSYWHGFLLEERCA